MLVLAAVASMANAAQAQGIEINDTNFPDANFRAYVSDATIDTNSDNYLSTEEIAAVTTINVSYKHITNLKGIEHFTALTKLYCYHNQLTALDVSKNTALTEMHCYDNSLAALNLSTNIELTKLICFCNQLSALEVSKNIQLTELSCESNKLTALDVSKNTALTSLRCNNNQLTTLDVSKNTALRELNCLGNQLTTLDMSKNTALTELDCYWNQLTTLDVSANTALTKLNCGSNQLTTLDVSANTALTQLYCSYNQLTTLDVSKNTVLMSLVCYRNQIKGDEMLALVNSMHTVTSGEFYVVNTQDSNEGNVITKSQVAIAKGKNWKVYDGSYYNSNTVEYAGDPGIEINETNFPDNNFRNHVSTSYDTDSDGYLSYEEIAAVTNINVSNKNIADLKGIEHFTALTELYCYKNQLTALDVSANIALTDLACDNNQLTTLDVSKNTALTRLYCYNNHLTTLDVLANTALTYLDCERNQLTALDVSKNTALKTLYCHKNQLTALDVSANIALTDLSCYGNQIQGNEMLALVNSLPIVTSGRFYVVDTQDSDEGNVITKSQVAIATGKNWKVYDYNGKNKVEYAGVEEYVLTLGIPTNGTLTAAPNGSVGEGIAIILTATPDEGYMLKTLKAYRTGDESQTVAISENKFTMPAYDVTVEAEFEAITYTLTYAAGEGGTIVGSTSQSVAQGHSGTEVEAKPNEGYKFVKWSDGLTTAKRTDSNVQANLSVTAEFEKSSTTGLFDTQLDALSVYPNPTTGMLWVSVPEPVEGTAANVLVYNINGQLLQRIPAHGASAGSAASRLSIDLSGYPDGMYFIHVGNAVAKVVKQ